MNKLAIPAFVFSCVLFLISTTMFIVASELVLFNWVTFLIGSVFLCLSLFLRRKILKRSLQSRMVKSLLREVTTFLLVISIIGLFNFLIYQNNVHFDLTKAKIHSLSEQTKKVLERFKDDKLSFTLFAKRADWERYLKLLNMYSKIQPNLEIRAVDVDSEPALVAMNKISENGTLIINYKKNEYRTVLKDELTLTNMLLKIDRPKDMIIYVSSGHSESDFSEEGPEGLSYLGQVLKNSNFKAATHSLAKKIPSDANAFLILKPQLSFSESEIKNLTDYITRGGSLILTLAPRFDKISLTNLERFLSENGVTFINGIALDRLSSSQGGQASVPMINQYPEDTPITKGFSGRTLFPVSSFFEIQNQDGFEWIPAIQTMNFPATWGETDFSEVKSGKAVYNENIDYKGPLNLSVVGKNREGEGKIVLFSSTAFITNQFQGQSNNFNLFLNAVSWATDERSIMSLNRPELSGNLVYISDIHFNLVFYMAILLFPFIFFGVGIYLYRRKLSH